MAPALHTYLSHTALCMFIHTLHFTKHYLLCNVYVPILYYIHQSAASAQTVPIRNRAVSQCYQIKHTELFVTIFSTFNGVITTCFKNVIDSDVCVER